MIIALLCVPMVMFVKVITMVISYFATINYHGTVNVLLSIVSPYNNYIPFHDLYQHLAFLLTKCRYFTFMNLSMHQGMNAHDEHLTCLFSIF